MGVVTARLLFLGFLVLTATVTYNALYLQEPVPHGMAGARAVAKAGTPSDTDAARAVTGGVENSAAATAIAKTSVAVTSLPPTSSNSGESLLVVRAVQRELAIKGYDVGPVDGQLTEKTRVAISAFQAREGLAATGLPSDGLLRQILLGDTVAASSMTGSVAASDSIAANSGEHGTVLKVQQVLSELGYAPGVIDGAFGENTARAVSEFQRDRNMIETGTITPQLLAEFQRVTGRDFTKTAARP